MIRRLLGLGAILAAVGVGLDRVLHRAGVTVRPVETFVVVDAPIENVWAVVSDVPRQPAWMADLRSVRLLDAGPVRPGTRAVGRVRILGIPVDDPVTIVAFEPPHRFAIRHEGRFRGGGEITLEAGADGRSTIVRWRERLVPPLLPRLVSFIQRPVLREVFQADLHRLRRQLETARA